ncbi:hypothetical protein BC629DRAFT_1685614 [Irpex lacteus]|nr:hypothetical protein BC629DRAFT_1685614 [Irpex lacteus]
MNACGTPDVPSFSALRRVQTKLTSEMGLKSTRHVSTLGNEFYNNGAAQTYRLDWANPLVRPHIRPYVEVSSRVSEIYQAQRLHNEDVDLLQLMWADFTSASHRHFYIKEVARTCDGRFVIPMKWLCIIDDQSNIERYCADAYIVKYDASSGTAHIEDQELVRIPASDLVDNYLDLEGQSLNFCFDQAAPAWAHNMPHPVRLEAKGRRTFTLGVMGWADDVSGNRSKQYNAHTNVYTANSSLPHRKLQQEYFIHFSSTSQHAGALEQLDGLSTDLGPEKWHEAYDCLLQEEILFRLILRLKPADNPQQSELCSHIGLHGNKFCRRCHAGGTVDQVESEEGYGELFTEGDPRIVAETIQEIRSQIVTATHGNEANVEKMQTSSGIKDPIAQKWIDQLLHRARLLHHERITSTATQDPRLRDRKLKGPARTAVRNEIIKNIEEELMEWLTMQPADRYEKLPNDSPLRSKLRPGDHYNVLLGLEGLNVHRDTVVEILHTYLLGLDKYTWHLTHSSWDNAQKELMAIRLQGSSVDGLSIPPVRGHYMVQYRNNLIGKHFKSLQQVGVFHLHPDLLETSHGTLLLDLWKATGELGAQLFCHCIDDMDTYLSDVEVLIGNLLDIWSTIEPSRILQKPKLHILRHIVSDIRNHGPAILYSTEIFECWNAIFRLCSVLSNHHAPSLDIASTMVDLERFKHQVSGGWWRSSDGTYICAGEGVQGMFESRTMMQSRLGWINEKELVQGLHSSTKRNSEEFIINIDQDSSLDRDLQAIPWEYTHAVISQSKDVCKNDSWVFYKGPVPENSPIVQAVSANTAIFHRTSINTLTCHRSSVNQGTYTTSFIPQSILFIFNAQHDCLTAECEITESNIQQERRATRLTQKSIHHGPMQRYFINMHAIHNSTLIRRTLPRSFSKPKPYYLDREAKHNQFANEASLANSNVGKPPRQSSEKLESGTSKLASSRQASRLLELQHSK